MTFRRVEEYKESRRTPRVRACGLSCGRLQISKPDGEKIPQIHEWTKTSQTPRGAKPSGRWIISCRIVFNVIKLVSNWRSQ